MRPGAQNSQVSRGQNIALYRLVAPSVDGCAKNLRVGGCHAFCARSMNILGDGWQNRAQPMGGEELAVLTDPTPIMAA